MFLPPPPGGNQKKARGLMFEPIFYCEGIRLANAAFDMTLEEVFKAGTGLIRESVARLHNLTVLV